MKTFLQAIFTVATIAGGIMMLIDDHYEYPMTSINLFNVGIIGLLITLFMEDKKK